MEYKSTVLSVTTVRILEELPERSLLSSGAGAPTAFGAHVTTFLVHD
jgi:hypothetical protein